MEALVLLVIVVAGLLLVDRLALAFGADSRDSVGDDHARRAAF